MLTIYGAKYLGTQIKLSVEIFLSWYYMSMSANGQPTSPFQQWQNFYPPYAFMPDQETKVIDAVTNVERNLTAGHSGLSKDIYQTGLGLRDAVERNANANIDAVANVERYMSAGHAGLTKDIHQTTLGLRDAVEKGTYANGHAIERNAGQLGSAIERNGGTIMTAIEKVAGEQRLTTTVTDAASRQANQDSARDLAIAIERNGANAVNASQAASGTLLASIERNAGENRVTTVLTCIALNRCK